MVQLDIIPLAYLILFLFAQWGTWTENSTLWRCEGVPYPLMLFILVMEPLHILYKKAQEEGLLEKVSNECEAFRVTLYADDAYVFITPSQ
jgi:hypothetical protein